MAFSRVQIFNMALSAAAAKGSVSDAEEDSREANLCRLWYDLVRQLVLKSASWPCAIKHDYLALKSVRGQDSVWTNTSPAPTFRYVYSEPSDCLAPRYLMDYSRFSRGINEDARVINASAPQAILTYSFDQTNEGLWDSGLANAVIKTLAAHISVDLTGKMMLYDRLLNKAREDVVVAQTDAANETDENYEALPSWIVARNYEGPYTTRRFYFPYENFSGLLA